MATTSGSPSLDIPPKPKPEDFAEPVAWLFGRQFIATFKCVLLYTAFKGKLDSRDWMKNEALANRFQNPFWWAYQDLKGQAETEDCRRLPHL